MDSSPCDLKMVIDSLRRFSSASVCVHDVLGILLSPGLSLPREYRIHAGRFCDLAKETPRGFSLCIRCKTRANCRAVDQRKPFSGYCPWGLYEVTWPVIIGGETAAILYIGNLNPDERQARQRLHAACGPTGSPEAAMGEALSMAQPAPELGPFFAMAQVLDQFIRLTLEKNGWKKGRRALPDCRWKAREAADYIEANYQRDLSLRQLAGLYFLNEKYLGQVFRQETGLTMRQYLSRVRLRRAAALLQEGTFSVTQIAMDCGFQNIPYFTRLFRSAYGVAPSQYGRQCREQKEEVAPPKP